MERSRTQTIEKLSHTPCRLLLAFAIFVYSTTSLANSERSSSSKIHENHTPPFEYGSAFFLEKISSLSGYEVNTGSNKRTKRVRTDSLLSLHNDQPEKTDGHNIIPTIVKILR